MIWNAEQAVRHGMILRIMVLSVFAPWTTAVVAAEDRVPAQLRACASVKKNSERLVCYDQAIAHLWEGQDGTIAAPAPSAESMFGMAASSSGTAPPAQSIEREALNAVTAHITALRADNEGLLLIELDNGQTWRQISGSSTLLLKIGDEATITRAALNSFRLSTPTGRTAKVKRVR